MDTIFKSIHEEVGAGAFRVVLDRDRFLRRYLGGGWTITWSTHCGGLLCRLKRSRCVGCNVMLRGIVFRRFAFVLDAHRKFCTDACCLLLRLILRLNIPCCEFSGLRKSRRRRHHVGEEQQRVQYDVRLDKMEGAESQ